MAIVRLCLALLGAGAAAGGTNLAWAGQPVNWQTGFQEAATPVAEKIHDFNDILFVLIVLIVAFVLALLLYVMWRFSERRNPTPSRTTHNSVLEVLWTVIPVIILVVIAIPSFKLLYFADRIEEADMTIKAIGRQWYWSYEYPDHGNFTFDANMVPDEDLEEGQPRLLATDQPVVVPVDTNVRLLVTASDVLHNFAMPSFGIKLDGVPGRVNETWFRVTREGTFYGQCSELCGTGHSYMPIEVKVVSKEAFEAWVKEAQEEFARADGPPEPAVASKPEEDDTAVRLAKAPAGATQ